MNESETIPTGSVQNSNINNTFVPSGVPASISDSQENSLQDNSFQEPTMNTLKTTNRAEDGVIPSAIVVKNIPFQIKKEQLLELFVRFFFVSEKLIRYRILLIFPNHMRLIIILIMETFEVSLLLTFIRRKKQHV